MFPRLSSTLLKVASRSHSFSSYSTVAVRTSTSAEPEEKIKPNDWLVESVSDGDKGKIVSFIKKHYLKENPLAKVLIPGMQPDVFMKMKGEALNQNLSVVARKTCEPYGDCSILGVCVNERSTACDGAKLESIARAIKCCNLQRFLEVQALMKKESCAHERLSHPEAFHIGTLSICEEHWGRGIGLALVRKSLELATQQKYKYAKMTCMCENTKKIAKSLGMREIWSAPYEDLFCRCSGKPRTLPESPHTRAYVYYINLKRF